MIILIIHTDVATIDMAAYIIVCKQSEEKRFIVHS